MPKNMLLSLSKYQITVNRITKNKQNKFTFHENGAKMDAMEYGRHIS
jgi:hypothetical protein